jgi:predicted aspartyl protease
MNKGFCSYFLFLIILTGRLFASDSSLDISINSLSINAIEPIKLISPDLFEEEKDTIRIPLIRAGNLFFIEAKIDTMEGNFLVDLGAPYLVLNATYFREYEKDYSYTANTLATESDFVKRAKIRNLSFYGIEYKNMEADVTDLGAIENRRGLKILGLLGVSIFREFVFDIDVKNQQLLLYKGSTKNKTNMDVLLEAPIKIENNVILIKARSNNVLLDLSIDSGAERNILDNTLNSSVYEGMTIMGSSVITDGNGGRSEALLTKLTQLSISDMPLENMYTLIINLEIISRAYGRQIDGMLGYPFFASGRVVIDFRRKQLVIYNMK